MAQSEPILFLTGDYAARLDALYAELDAAQKDTTPRTALEGDPVAELAVQFRTLKAEAEEAGTRAVLTAVGRRQWRALKEKHPPRTEGHEDDVKGDRLAGVNVETVEDDLVHASLTEPKFDTRHDFDQWADTLSEGEWQTLVRKAWELANGARFNPKDLPSSLTPSDG